MGMMRSFSSGRGWSLVVSRGALTPPAHVEVTVEAIPGQRPVSHNLCPGQRPAAVETGHWGNLASLPLRSGLRRDRLGNGRLEQSPSAHTRFGRRGRLSPGSLPPRDRRNCCHRHGQHYRCGHHVASQISHLHLREGCDQLRERWVFAWKTLEHQSFPAEQEPEWMAWCEDHHHLVRQHGCSAMPHPQSGWRAASAPSSG